MGKGTTEHASIYGSRTFAFFVPLEFGVWERLGIYLCAEGKTFGKDRLTQKTITRIDWFVHNTVSKGEMSLYFGYIATATRLLRGRNLFLQQNTCISLVHDIVLAGLRFHGLLGGHS